MQQLREVSFSSGLTKSVAFVVLGVLLMTFSAKMTIPIQPVPITMHELGIVLIGLMFTPTIALTTQLSYVGLGLLGVPVFSNMLSGPAIIFGPKGGFILSFLLGSFIISALKDKFNTKYSHWIAASIGLLFVFACGVTWLANFVGIQDAFKLGLLPFMIPLVVKMGIICSSWSWFTDTKK